MVTFPHPGHEFGVRWIKSGRGHGLTEGDKVGWRHTLVVANVRVAWREGIIYVKIMAIVKKDMPTLVSLFQVGWQITVLYLRVRSTFCQKD
jgi:hypothetical protein